MKRTWWLFGALAIATALVVLTAWEQTDFLAETIRAYRGGPLPPDPLGYFIEWPVLAWSMLTQASPLQAELELAMCWLVVAWCVLASAGISSWRRFYILIGPPVLMAAGQGHAILIGAAALAIASLVVNERPTKWLSPALMLGTVAIRADLIVLVPVLVLWSPTWREAAARLTMLTGGLLLVFAFVVLAPISFDALGGSALGAGRVTSPASLWSLDAIVPVGYAHVAIVVQLGLLAIIHRLFKLSMWRTAVTVLLLRAVLDPWFVIYYLTPAWMAAVVAVTARARACADCGLPMSEHFVTVAERRGSL
jgi:hypothetical protein